MLSGLTENLSLKLFSLAVAVLLFLFVSVESATPVDVDFRIEYRTASDIMIVGDAPAVLHTTIKGPWATFRSYDINELKPVIIDLSAAGPGSLRHALDTSDIEPPGGMSVVAIRPSEVNVTLDRKTERQVPVQVDVIGRPSLGYEPESVEASPGKVTVSGPATVLQTLDFVFTRPIDLQDRQDDFDLEVDLSPPPPPLRLKEKHVGVSVRIVEELVTRPFDNLVVRGDDAPAGTRFVPDKITVKLKGPRNLVDAIDPKALEPHVDLQPEFDEGQATFEKPVLLRGNPERTQWIGALPRVQVQIPKNRVKKPKPRK